MHRHRNSLWSYSPSGIAAAALLSILFSLVCGLFFSLFIYLFMDDLRLIPWFAVLSCASGSFTGGFVLGKHRRRKGLAEGLLCGAAVWLAFSAAGLLWTGRLAGIKKLLLLAVSGAAGGVSGVNSKRPRSLRD